MVKFYWQSRRISLFSLVEMLIVVAIIGILTSLMVPALNKMLLHAENLQCMSQHRQAGQITSMYTDDYYDTLPHEDFGTGGRYPQDSCWVNALDVNAFDGARFKQEDGYTIKMNSRLEDYKGNKSFKSVVFRKLNTVPSPELTPFLFEARNSAYYKNKPYGMHRTVEAHHDEEVNILFLDLSARSIWNVPRQGGGWLTTAGLWWDPDAPLSKQLNY